MNPSRSHSISAASGAKVRAVLALIALSMLCFATSQARAQDPRTSMVQDAARAWLAETDRGDGAASWKLAGQQFQSAIPVERWTESLNQVRKPVGAVVERAALSTRFLKSFPGAPDGVYAMVVYRTTFANKTDARETVTLAREADKVWRVIGYFIQ